MSLELQIQVSLNLALAAFLSMVLGLNRESLNQPAGLRTHMLVGLGSALFTIVSMHAFPNSEPARVAAQVVTGVGFLGAGTILQRKGDVHYLTTAASIWATAAVGMTAGVGAWFLAITATLIAWFVLAVIRRVESEKYEEDPKARKASRSEVEQPVMQARPQHDVTKRVKAEA